MIAPGGGRAPGRDPGCVFFFSGPASRTGFARRPFQDAPRRLRGPEAICNRFRAWGRMGDGGGEGWSGGDQGGPGLGRSRVAREVDRRPPARDFSWTLYRRPLPRSRPPFLRSLCGHAPHILLYPTPSSAHQNYTPHPSNQGLEAVTGPTHLTPQNVRSSRPPRSRRLWS